MILNDILWEHISVNTPEFNEVKRLTNIHDSNWFFYNGSYYEIEFYFSE